MRNCGQPGHRYRFPPRRVGVVLVVSGVLLSGVGPSTSGVLGTQSAGAASAGRYSAPEWFPLRRDLSGADITIGCTYLSHGSQGGFDCGGDHSFWALDLLAVPGTEIHPAGAGYATDVTGQAAYSGYGNVVVVDHGNNVKSLYAHMSRVLVGAAGAWVDPNTVIGTVGSTGSATVAHLHFETTSSGRFAAGSRDPGALKACHGSQLVTYPQAWGLSSWQGIPWGTRSAHSDGTGCTAAGAAKAATIVVGDPARRQPLGLLGLSGTRIVYAAHLRGAGGSGVAGATLLVTIPGRRGCAAVTDASGTAACNVTYPLFGDPPPGTNYTAKFSGDSSHLPATTVGSMS